MISRIHHWFIYLIPISLVFSIFVADLLVSITAITFLINQIYKKNYKIFLNKYFIFFFVFWFYLILNSLLSYNINLSLSRSLPYLRFGIFFLAISFYIGNEQFKKNFLKIVLYLIILICIDGIIQYFFGHNLLGYKGHISRISSFFNDELVLGSFLLKIYPLFLISLIILKDNKLISNKLIQISLISFYAFIVYISGERTAFFNFILFNIILFIIFFEKKYLKYLIIFLLIFFSLISISFLFNKNTIERYLTVKNIFKSNGFIIFTKTHEEHYVTAFKIFKSNKVFGSGLKTFRYICKKPIYNPEGCATHPHNTFMQFLSELGLLGLFFYLISFIYFIIKLFKFFLRKVINKVYIELIFIQTVLILSIVVSLWPLSPSGNFFNNWQSILSILPIGFLIFYEKKIKLA